MYQDELRDEDDLVREFRERYYERLSTYSKSWVDRDHSIDDAWMEIYSFLQCTINENIEVDDILLGQTAASAAKFGDPDLWKRIICWISEHLKKNNGIQLVGLKENSC